MKQFITLLGIAVLLFSSALYAQTTVVFFKAFQKIVDLRNMRYLYL